MKTDMTENGEDVENAKMKEWRGQNGHARIETESQDEKEKSISVNDGETITTYQEELNQAMVIDNEDILDFNQPSPKEQVDMILDMVRDTHDIKGQGEKTIAGRSAYYLVATPLEDGTLFDEQEIWIDKENWLILKMISQSGNQRTEIVYDNIEFNTTIPEETFSLALPDDVEIIETDDLLETEEVTLEEAQEGVGHPFYYIPETDGLEMSAIEMDELTGELDRTEINIEYEKDGLPYVSLSVFESPEDDNEDALFSDEEPVTIRNQEGTYIDSDGFRALFWQEDGLNDSMIIIEPSLTLEDLQSLTDEMDLIE